MKICEVCSSNHLVEVHHIVKRSQVPALINCKYNLIPLCWEHHKGNYGIHGVYGHKLDRKLKKDFQEKLQLMFGENIYYSKEQIREKLDIDLKELDKLLKTLLPMEGKYKGIDIIRVCMGGKLVL